MSQCELSLAVHLTGQAMRLRNISGHGRKTISLLAKLMMLFSLLCLWLTLATAHPNKFSLFSFEWCGKHSGNQSNGGENDPSRRTSNMQTWEKATNGKKKGYIYCLGAFWEELSRFPLENIGSSSEWETKIEEMNSSIIRMNEKLWGVMKAR